MPTQTELEELVTRFVVENRDLIKKLKESEVLFRQHGKAAEESSHKVSEAFGGLGATALGTAASLFGLSSALETVQRSISLAANAESLATTFKVLIGDADKAKKTLADLQEFALKTPFEMPELLEASKQMAAFGEEAENLVPTMRTLGDVSAGLEIPLRDLTYLYGTLKSQGRAYSIDIKQFAIRGIPIYRELAKVFGLIGANAKKVTPDTRMLLDNMIEAGNVNFQHVEKAFQNMTREGGAFFNLMEERSKTLQGVWNELKEGTDLILRDVGNVLVEGLNLNAVVRQITDLGNEFKRWIGSLSADTRRAIIIVSGLIGVFVALTAAIALAGIVWTVFTGGLNIWIGVATAGIALIGLWVYKMGGLQDAWKKAQRAASDFWDFIKPILPAIGVALVLVTGYFSPFYAAIVLAIVYWKELYEAAKSFADFIEPSLRPLWSLIKTLGFALRDNILSAQQEIQRQLEKLPEIVDGIWKQLGGQTIDWRQIKYGLRDLVIFAEFGFKNMKLIWEAALAGMKFAAVYAVDEIIKNIFGVFVLVAFPGLMTAMLLEWTGLWDAAAQALDSFVKWTIKTIKDMIVGIMANYGELMKALEDAIKKGDFSGLKAALDKVMVSVAVDIKKIQDEIGSIKIKGPGIEIQGLTKLRQQTRQQWVEAQERVKQGFTPFRDMKLKQFQLEDAAETVQEVLDKVIIPLMQSGTVKAAEAGSKQGQAFVDAFGKEAKKLDSVLFGSLEALERMQEYKDNIVQAARIRPPSTFNNQINEMTVNPMPARNTTLEERMVDLLLQIANSSAEIAKKEPLKIIPGQVP